MVAAKEQARDRARQEVRRRAPLAKALGLGLALVWIGVLVWLGIVLVRLKAAGPEALRVPDAGTAATPLSGTAEPDAGMRDE